jgi:hypothetical protein
LGEREPIEDFLTGEYREGPAHLMGAGQLSRRLLTTFLELFRALNIPVILVFDQLEDFLVAPTAQRKEELRDTFGQALAALINNVPGLCMLVFAERGLWNQQILGRLEPYVRDRLDRDFTLPGRPSQKSVSMPDHIDRSNLVRLIDRRIRTTLGDFSTTGLPPAFPFEEAHLKQLEAKESVRACLRTLSSARSYSVRRPRGLSPRRTVASPHQHLKSMRVC